jgi:hypothetical protein
MDETAEHTSNQQTNGEAGPATITIQRRVAYAIGGGAAALILGLGTALAIGGDDGHPDRPGFPAGESGGLAPPGPPQGTAPNGPPSAPGQSEGDSPSDGYGGSGAGSGSNSG